jgi:hypothetical protein
VFALEKNGSSAIAEFWQWWSRARDRVAAGIRDGSIGSMADEIGDQVAAINDDLQWELSPGRNAQHALVVTSGGDATLRATVSRWLAAAPPADAVFEYVGSRQPDDRAFTARMRLDGHELDLSEIRFAFDVDDHGHGVDVEVFHPEFARMPEPARVQVGFLALDWALGEEQVELWVGAVEAPPKAPDELRTLTELRATVAALANRHAEPVYAMLEALTDRGMPLLAVVQVPLKGARWPRFDTHVAVKVGFPARENGLPIEEALALLRDHEDSIAAAVGDDGEVVAHETCEGLRTLHVYVDGTTPAAMVAAETARNGPYDGRAEINYDPRFARVDHLRV